MSLLSLARALLLRGMPPWKTGALSVLVVSESFGQLAREGTKNLYLELGNHQGHERRLKSRF